MAHSNEAGSGLPQITVEIPDGDSSNHSNNDPRTPPRTPAPDSPETAISPGNLSAAPVNGYRDRAMSGSTLAPPKSAGGASSSSTASLCSCEEQQDALKPDPGADADFAVDANAFAFSPGQLNKLLNPKSLPAYVALGGLAGIEKGLRSDRNAGLSIDETTLPGTVTFDEATKASSKSWAPQKDGATANAAGTATAGTAHDPASHSNAFSDRIRVYKRNVLPAKKPRPLWKLMWLAYNDKVLILLTVAAAISLALGLYETFGVEHPPGSPMPVDWIEGCAICIAIVIVVLVGALNDYQKERAFVRLNTKKEDREVKVIRSARLYQISVHDVLVGDVVHLEPGDLVPADGVFVAGHSVKCDESSATGESDQMKKTAGDQVLRLVEQGHAKHGDLDPFIISGSKVLEGVGTYLVTSVGVNSSYGKILMAMRQDPEPTPLQVKLDGLAGAIAKLGSSAAAFLFFVLLFRFLATLPGSALTANEKASRFMDMLIVAITVVVVAVPEGLPLAVTLALAFATTRLVKLNNLVRILKSCETMGNATTVCSDKTGTLTQNKMTVVAGTFGADFFDDKNQRGDERRSAAFAAALSAEHTRRLVDSIAINSTAFEGDEAGEAGFIGSKTETALLGFARHVLGMASLSEERANAHVAQLMPFDSGRKCMGAVHKLPGGGGYRFLVKGASEMLLARSTSLLTARGAVPLNHAHFERVITGYAEQSLRTIALVSRDFPQWPPPGTASAADPSAANADLVLRDMTLLGVVGIQDPIRPGVPQAVAKCARAGVTVRMVTGDNVVTATAIAADCGIYTDGGVVMEGPAFRTLSDAQMAAVLPRLQVLARSSPEDKRVLVSRLRAMGDVVAVTGDGTNDGPALKAADIGFSMGIAGTEVAKEASAIILMDDNFASILTALMWGRAVNDAVRKFLQFQLTVNITAVLLTFVSSVADAEMRSVLTAVQLLWINLIMDSLAALALATDPPTEQILDRKPPARHASLISTVMWKMITGQALFQLGVTLVLFFGGPRFLGYADAALRSVVFNCFVWMQVFNMFNNRRLDNRFNVLAGAHRNGLFVVVCCVMVGCQVAIAFVGGKAFGIVRLTGPQWALSVIVAALCLPWAVLVRLFPDAWFERLAGWVGAPVLFVYRPLRRAAGRLGHAVKRMFGKGKKTGEEEEEQSEMAEAGSDLDAVRGNGADAEKGGAGSA